MKAKISTFALVGIVVVIVIVALAAYAWISIGKYIHTAAQPALKVEAANQTGTLSQVMQNITGGFNTSQFTAAYSGNATLGIDGLQFSIPMTINVSQYNSFSRAAIKVSGVPLVGNLSLVQIKNAQGYYSCSKGGTNSSAKYECMLQNSSNSIFSLFNLSSSSLGNATVHFKDINQSSHNGIPCTNIGGYFNYSNSTKLNSLDLSSKIGQSVSSANFTFLSCVSSQRIPLSMEMSIAAKSGNSTSDVTLKLSETSFSQTSSSAIGVLPGPIVNSTTNFGRSG